MYCSAVVQFISNFTKVVAVVIRTEKEEPEIEFEFEVKYLYYVKGRR